MTQSPHTAALYKLRSDDEQVFPGPACSTEYTQLVGNKNFVKIEQYIIQNANKNDFEHLPFGIFDTVKKGRDVFSFVDLPAGCPLFCYSGRKVSSLNVSDHDNHTIVSSQSFAIVGDQTSFGCLVNHSFKPNIKPYMVKTTGGGVFYLFKTIHAIKALNSLSWTYNMKASKEERLLYPFLQKKKPNKSKCRCKVCSLRFSIKHPLSWLK